MSHPPPAAAPLADAAPPAGAGSGAQLARLESEWRQLRRAFAYHPFVEILPLSEDPPVAYQIQYKVTTLAINEAGQLAYVSSCPVHLWLPPQFPHNAPVLRPMAAAFHPNVAMEWIHLNPPWHPDASLVDVVSQVGLLLAFRSYDPNAVANPVAMNWAFANAHLLPTDPGADFSPAAGGEPLVRLARFGAATLRELREKLESAAKRIVAADPGPAAEELEQLSLEARATLPLFIDPDLPQHLRTTAVELRDLAGSLTERESVWSRVARQVALSKAAAAAGNELVKAEESLRRVLAAEATRPAHPPASDRRAHRDKSDAAATALSRVPTPEVIQPAALALRRAVSEAEHAVEAMRDRLGALAAAPRIPAAAAPPNSILSRRLARELSRLADASEPARAAGAWLASLEPVLDVARHESAAADRVAAWADHHDLLRRGRELVERLKSGPCADLQAYHIETPAGTAGPFEFEQRVDPGDGGPPIAVWNLRSRLVRVVDAGTEELIGRGDGRGEGRVILARPGAAGGARTLCLVVAEHTDELRVQLEYLLTQTADALSRLRPPEDEPPPPAEPTTWPARLAAELDQHELQGHADADHRRATDDWKHLLADLATLGRFKNRMATCHLLTRLVEFVPRAQAERERLRAIMTGADAHLAEIGARSARDSETNRLIIPAQYAADYAARLAERDGAQQRIQRLHLALDGAIERVKLRLAKRRLYGSSEVGEFRVLRPLPQAYAEQQPRFSDEAMHQRVHHVEDLLGTSLRPPAAEPRRADPGTATPGPTAPADE